MFGKDEFIKMSDGTEIYSKILEKGHSKWLIVTHGIGEHLERHNYMLNQLSGSYNILLWDLRGHGRSEGKRAYISDFKIFMDDLKEVLHYLIKNYKMNNYSLFGHSMGALITCSFIQNYLQNIPTPEKVFVNAPPVSFPGVLGGIVKRLKGNYVEKLSQIPYSLPIGGLVDLAYLSHDPIVKKDYIEDELNAPKLHSKLILGMVDTSKKTFSRPLGFKGDFLCTYGSGDKIINPDAIESYSVNVDKSFKFLCIEDAYHEIHNEIEKYRMPYLAKLKEFLVG